LGLSEATVTVYMGALLEFDRFASANGMERFPPCTPDARRGYSLCVTTIPGVALRALTVDLGRLPDQPSLGRRDPISVVDKSACWDRLSTGQTTETGAPS
jgi:hypothetical protein